MASRYLSRKFIIDLITMTVLGLISSVAVGYGLINVKDANNELKAGVFAATAPNGFTNSISIERI